MKPKEFEFEMGCKVKDIITGFIGVVISRTQWLTNCNNYGVNPQELKDGKPIESQYFDENRLILEDETNILDVYEKKKQIGGSRDRDRGGPQDIPREPNRF